MKIYSISRLQRQAQLLYTGLQTPDVLYYQQIIKHLDTDIGVIFLLASNDEDIIGYCRLEYRSSDHNDQRMSLVH